MPPWVAWGVPCETPVAAVPLPRAPFAGALGMLLPTFRQLSAEAPTASELATLCRRAERAGASALWACDHLFWHGPAVECLASVTVAATATERAVVGPCVLQLPLRRAAVVAKQAASISQLSEGRLVLGVGIGNHRGEYEAAAASYDSRGRQLDGAIAELRRAWSSAEDQSRYRQLPPAGQIPIWVGGSSEAALRRAARLADGWIPLFVPPTDYAAALERLDKESDRAGRDPAEIARAIVVFVSIGGTAARDRGLEWMSSLYSIPPDAFARYLVTGDAASVARALAEFEEAGAQHVAVFVTDDDPVGQFEELASELTALKGTL